MDLSIRLAIGLWITTCAAATDARANRLTRCAASLYAAATSELTKKVHLWEMIDGAEHPPLPIPEALAAEVARVKSFYKKYHLAFATPAALAAIIGYIAKEHPAVQLPLETHYSSIVLYTALLNQWYSMIASGCPLNRLRWLRQAIALSMVIHMFWEVGPLVTPFDRIVPQVPRAGTDWGDLVAGTGSATLYGLAVHLFERLHFRHRIPHPVTLDFFDRTEPAPPQASSADSCSRG